MNSHAKSSTTSATHGTLPRHSAARAVALVVALCGIGRAQAQERPQATLQTCRQAATVLRAYDEAALRSGGHAVEGGGKSEERQMAAAQLLRCGAFGGTTAAWTIRQSRMLSDTAVLKKLVGPFRNFRDTAVVSAVMNVADDATASVPARVFALRAIWVLRTGRYWIAYDWLLPGPDSDPTTPRASCGVGVVVSDATPLWEVGVEPPVGFEQSLRLFAQNLAFDRSQPDGVRAAALCAARR